MKVLTKIQHPSIEPYCGTVTEEDPFLLATIKLFSSLFSDTKFKQQKLPAWQPIMTAGTVLPAFFAIGICFIPLGIGLLISSNNVSPFLFCFTKKKYYKG